MVVSLSSVCISYSAPNHKLPKILMVAMFSFRFKPRQHNIKMKLRLASIPWCKNLCDPEEDYGC